MLMKSFWAAVVEVYMRRVIQGKLINKIKGWGCLRPIYANSDPAKGPSTQHAGLNLL